MPRNRALRGKFAHPRDTGSFVPYLNSFCELLQTSESLTETTTLINEYLHYISIRLSKLQYEKYANQARSGFRRAFRTMAIIKTWRESSKPRGYFVTLSRVPRTRFSNFTRKFAKNEKLFEKIFIDKKVGFGIFAVREIHQGTIILEYKGQWISKQENEKREKFYARNGFVPVAVHDPFNGQVLDANRDENGQLFDSDENLARYFNHSRKFPNCKLVRERGTSGAIKLYLQSVSDVPRGAELLWDYGDMNRDNTKLNPWLKYS